MIKEIVDIGRVSNRLGSVFTFKGLPEYYVEVVLEFKNGEFKLNTNTKPKEIRDKELYLQYGVFRGKSGSNIFIFPSSFLIDVTCDYVKLKEAQASLENGIEDKKLLKKIETQYKAENKKFIKDKEKYKKEIESGIKILKKFFDELRKEKLNECKKEIIKKISKKEFNTKKERTQYKKLLTEKCNNKYKKDKNYKLLNYLESIANLFLKNDENIIKLADICKKYISSKTSENIERIPIVVKAQSNNNEYFIYEKYFLFQLYEKLIFNNSAQTLKKDETGLCNIYHKYDKLFAPKSSFYYAFSLDKINVYPNLNKQETLNLFNLSYKAYIDFLIGRNFLETLNSFYFMGLNSYITATTLNDERLKEFQKDIKDSKSDINSLIDLIDKNRQNRSDLLINFYFYEPTKTGNNVVEYIKDVIPTRLVDLLNLFKKLTNYYKIKFDKENFKISWQQHIYSIYYKDEHKKFRTSLFRKIALGDKVDLARLLQVINKNMEFSISKDDSDKQKYYYGTVIKHLMFLNWIDKINKGELKMSKDEKNKELFVGKSYEDRLKYFLENATLVKDSASMKMGVCVGLPIQILSWTLSNYDKKTLAFVSKRIERNNLNSVQVFINDIFAKTKFQEYEGLQSVNISLATKMMLELDDGSFNKDEFIFGLFLGSELYKNVKSEKDPEPEEGEENDKSTTGESDE